jgi:prevent-host-death family protein
MKQVNIHEAKTHLSRLVEAAARGEAFVIAKAGKPLVKVVPLDAAEERAKVRRFGFIKGQVAVPDDFGTFMQDEIVAMFEGEYEAGPNVWDEDNGEKT